MITKVELIGVTADLKGSKTVIDHKKLETMKDQNLIPENRVENITTPILFNFHIDFVKLEIPYNYWHINFDNLVEHPTIKNQYKLKPEIWKYHKNFSLYLTKKKAILKFSIPYFLNGHNFCKLYLEDFWQVEEFISKNLGLEITFAEVKELEFGAYEEIDIDAKDYINSIVGIKNYELEKSTKGFKMFGDRKRNFHYKVYDAVANAKTKKTFTLGNYPDKGLIKHEIKLTNTSPYFDSVFYNDLYEPFASYWDELKEDLINSQRSLVRRNSNPVLLQDTDLSSILYAGLKQYESGATSENVMKSLFDLIDNSGLTPSQKSKRRKAISILESSYNQKL
ncbi:hypothetical protein BAZ12_18655 [Elizabethkingia miricola]|uniref:Replication initiation factor n=1 Tax=Elizabethkingia miricola TaxID=172045 RepID=A0ABD4DKD9_ELIMR|nr:hypothetical protein [Elizabethkingia miricola]KUY17157.1 hypothetical protein ATB95_12315 [Elizabethkingia miricola]OPC72296.1 hypothetical protein BAZ13_06225 [Elizabethkingia miricola]OPC76037.1 hypothetical protein BAZ12_18655 [Elizabethkingia miricola]SPW31946.1 Uncharacterised protein [Elizabethkingia miricola]